MSKPTPRPAPTAGQQRVLDAIREHFAEHQMPPTYRDLMKACKIASPNGVTRHTRELAVKGYIEIEHGVSRGLRLVLEDNDACPCCGRKGKG